MRRMTTQEGNGSGTTAAGGPRPFFSIVVACCDVEKYVRDCFDSLTVQAFADWECVAYVEESKDATERVVRELAAADPRFRVLTGPRSGSCSVSRNVGIDEARGEYIVFVDGDDRVAPDMLERLAAKLSAAGKPDMLSFAARQTDADGVVAADAKRISNFRAGDEEGAFSGPDAIRRMVRNRGPIHAYTWLNAWRTAFLRENDLRFLPGMALQDVDQTSRAFFLARRCAYLDRELYFYRRRRDSATDTRTTRFIRNFFPVLRHFLEFVAARDVPDDILRQWSNQWLSLMYWIVFHPVTSGRMTDAERAAGFKVLAENGGLPRFRTFARHASPPKRVALPFVMLAARGRPRAARLFFKHVYYPVLSLRDNWLERRGRS